MNIETDPDFSFPAEPPLVLSCGLCHQQRFRETMCRLGNAVICQPCADLLVAAVERQSGQLSPALRDARRRPQQPRLQGKPVDWWMAPAIAIYLFFFTGITYLVMELASRF